MRYNVRDFGAKGDGSSDDGPSFRKALDKARPGGGVVYVPAGVYLCVATDAAVCLGLTDGVTVEGDGMEATSFLMTSDKDSSYREAFRIDGSYCGLRDLSIGRRGPVSSSLITVYNSLDTTLERVRIDGSAVPVWPDVHGIQFASGPFTSINFKILHSIIQNCHYGLWSRNDCAATIDGFLSSGCSHRGNWSDDYCFNGPSGSFGNVRVSCGTFEGNRSAGSEALGGAAVSFARVSHGSVSMCHASGYMADTIHIEDSSIHINIIENTFASCSVNGYGIVNIINDSEYVSVKDNTFIHSSACPCVLSSTGGDYPNPRFISVVGNTFDFSDRAGLSAVSLYSSLAPLVSGNLFVGRNRKGYGIDFRNATSPRSRDNRFINLAGPHDPGSPIPTSFYASGNVEIKI